MGAAPTCLWCGRAIAKRTRHHEFSHADASAPTSKAECQRLVNEQVVHVSYWHTGRVRFFSTWDGESYADSYFDTGACAQRFAREAARLGVRLR